MAHPGDDVQCRARNRGSQGLAVTERIDRILVAMHDRGRCGDRRQRGEQARVVHPHGPVMVGRGRRVTSPRQRQLQHRASGRLIEGPNWPVEDSEQGHIRLHARREPGGLMREKLRRRRRQILRVGWLPGPRPLPRRTRIMTHRRAGHHGQRPDALRRVHAQPLRDHAAHRSPSHMSGTQTITVQYSQAVASHVPDRVRMSIEVDNAGPTRVPMIEADHLNPTFNKPINQFIRATDTLSSGTHDHQDSGKSRIPDSLGPNPQRPGGHKSLVGIQHGGTVAATCCRTPTFSRWPGRQQRTATDSRLQAACKAKSGTTTAAHPLTLIVHLERLRYAAMEGDDAVPTDDQVRSIPVGEPTRINLLGRHGRNPVVWLLALPIRVVVLAGLGVVLLRYIRRQRDEVHPVSFRTSPRSIELSDLAESLATQHREDDNAAQLLREKAGRHRNDLRRAATRTRSGDWITEDRVTNRANELLLAALENRPVEPTTDEQVAWFARVDALSEGNDHDAFARLVALQPKLADVDRSITHAWRELDEANLSGDERVA